MKTHENDSIRFCRITEELKASKLPFTTGGKEYRADANSTVGGITRGIDKRKGILECVSISREAMSNNETARIFPIYPSEQLSNLNTYSYTV